MSIKSLKQSDITVRPFKTFKTWFLQNIGDNNELTDAVCDLYKSKFTDPISLFCTNPPSASLLYNPADSDKFRISFGEKTTGIFFDTGSQFYSASANPLNTDGTYKGLVYNAIKSQFYEFSNPEHRFGIETIDFDASGRQKEIRKIRDQVTVGQIPKSMFGESIRPNSVTMIDLSNPDEVYTLADDGYTNLTLTDKYFQKELSLSSMHLTEHHANDRHLILYPTTSFNPLLERFGREVDFDDGYLVIGAPDDSGSLTHPKAGWAHIMKFDTSESIFRSLKTFYSPWSQHAVALEIATDDSWLLELEQGGYVVTSNQPSPYTSEEDRFGSAISLNNQFFAIGAPNIECFSGSKAGTVFVQDKYKGGIDHWGTINVLESGIKDDEFGFAVKINENILAVGAPGYLDDRGAVYIYQRKTFTHQTDPCLDTATSSFYQVLTPEDNFFFPTTNSFCANEFILEDEDSGSLYIEDDTPSFVSGTNTFIFHGRIVAPDNAPNERFGGCIDIYNDTMVIGNDKKPEYGGGKVYVYKFLSESVVISGSNCISGSWVPACVMDKDYGLTASLSLPGFAKENSGDAYGHAVAIEGGNIIVGCPNFGLVTVISQSYNIGAAYAYESGDVFEDGFFCNNCCDPSLLATASCTTVFSDRFVYFGETFGNNWFGTSVDISENRFIVGCPTGQQFVTASYDGSDYTIEMYDREDVHGHIVVYRQDSNLDWKLEKDFRKAKLQGWSKQQFGDSVKMTPQYIFVGAPSYVGTESASAALYPSSYHDLDNLKDKLPMNVSGSVYVYDTPDLNNYFKVGNVFYKNGLVTITDTGSFFGNMLTGTGSRGHLIKFKGEHTIYENEYLIPVEPGEFNISTNPTALLKETVILDINGDGVFDFDDLDLILRYLNKFKFLTGTESEVDNGHEIEQTEAWWNNDIIITEAEDAILLDGFDTDALQEEFEADGGKLTKQIFDKLVEIDQGGYLDFDGDGNSNSFDASILINYFNNIRNQALIDELINDNSTRNTPDQVANYLDNLTGKFNFTRVNPEFNSYLESSSLDKTGSYLSPYVTSIGLYNERYEMVAVAKLAKPIKILQNQPLNFNIRIDI